jgi:hypothetical protein
MGQTVVAEELTEMREQWQPHMPTGSVLVSPGVRDSVRPVAIATGFSP